MQFVQDRILNRLSIEKKISESIKKMQTDINPNLGKIRNKVECPRCGKQGAMNTMSRWHFNNCSVGG
jgi:late competence protein required for DNA uptake (superfamily II DNA/RNA helicase)